MKRENLRYEWFLYNGVKNSQVKNDFRKEVFRLASSIRDEKEASMDGLIKAVIKHRNTKKYARIIENMMPSLRRQVHSFHFGEAILACADFIAYKDSTVREVMELLQPFNFSQYEVEKCMVRLQEAGKLHVDLQADLDNVFFN